MKQFMKITATGAYLFVCAMLLVGVNAQAYIDPSALTYLIQVVAGVLVAVGAVAGLYFRRAKKKINEKLGIDENANKEVESDEITLDTDADK